MPWPNVPGGLDRLNVPDILSERFDLAAGRIGYILQLFFGDSFNVENDLLCPACPIFGFGRIEKRIGERCDAEFARLQRDQDIFENFLPETRPSC